MSESKVVKEFQWGEQRVRFETGEIARQASGAVLVDIEDTVVLATVVGAKHAKPGQEFFPLTVDYVEKAYAAGRIPGGYFRREGRPSEGEILISRLIDRPLRPLFPEGFYNEVQVIVHVLSVNPDVPTDIPSMLAASAALAISGIPFNGPVGAARVAYIDDQYVLNPTYSQLKAQSEKSGLDLVVAGTETGVLMVEAQANQLSEAVMLDAVAFAHTQMQTAIQAIEALAQEAGKPEWDWAPVAQDASLVARITTLAEEGLKAAYLTREKQARTDRIRDVYTTVNEKLMQEAGASVDAGAGGSMPNSQAVNTILFDLESRIVRNQVLSGEPRIDGRSTREVRPISVRTGVLSRTHGSALFTRGETQALAVATLGTKSDGQIIDAIEGEYRDRFMLHYNMPPFATGETGRTGSPKRREIGHGRLAKRALAACMPSEQEFGYTVRLVSEITESNGSSSMASVCGGCLALLDAGVPMKEHVAGIAMGLILDLKDQRFAVLTDILGDEDHLGDMDFKVAGTQHGITALQMDIKIQGVPKEIMQCALEQAREGRLHILKIMQEAVSGAREELSAFAPRMVTMQINPEKIRDIIGKGGSVIRGLTEETGTNIDIADDGTLTVSGTSTQAIEEAQRRIREITIDVEVGQVYTGTIIKMLEFGAIVNILPNRDGLLHKSEITREQAPNIQEGKVIDVKVIQMDGKGRIRLSSKAVESATPPASSHPEMENAQPEEDFAPVGR